MTPRRLAPLLLAVALAPAPAAAQPSKDKPTVLKVRIYNSLLPGYSRGDAKAFTEPMIALIGKNLGVPAELDVEEGTTPDDLYAFGKKLQNGDYHLGAVWGTEYGWLREKYPNLKASVFVSPNGHDDMPNRTLILVAKNSRFKTLADLKGKRLAVFKDMPFMDRVSLRAMLQDAKLEPKNFFVKGDPLGTVLLAAAAVKNGKADCVAMAVSIYFRLKELHPGLAEHLIELKAGEIYPDPVIIGSPEVVNRLRKKLWDDLQAQFLEMHTSPEGKDCVNFWRIQGFLTPDAAYERKVDTTARKFPKEMLLNLD
jgi:ABC-type phosphate/phosphonate transport system substrate-binding protein